MGLVDTASREFESWLQAEARGFHADRFSAEAIAEQLDGYADRRTTGVWDETAVDPSEPVSTVSSWPTELTVPGFASVGAWAISSVTVSPTHRRRGLARAMLEAELRTARSLGLPVAILTVSEATIYARYGFAPAASATDWAIDVRRAEWIGPEAAGRVQFVRREQLLADGPAIIERVRLATPGQIGFSGLSWERLLGMPSSAEQTKQLRFVRYDDDEGHPQGFAIYRVTEPTPDFSEHVVEVQYLVSATDDAYAGLWRFLLEMDLVSSVTAALRPVDEALGWQLSNVRAMRAVSTRDHLWTRILDVPAALSARSYGTTGRIVLEVGDQLGFADGRFLLDIATDGSAAVVPFEGAIPEDAAAISLGVNELSALYLGGVSALSLARAGRLIEVRDGSAVAVDAAFRSIVAPWLSIWF